MECKIQKTMDALQDGYVFWRGWKAGKPTGGWTAEKDGKKYFRVHTVTMNKAVTILDRKGFAITQDAWRTLISQESD